MKIRGVSLEYGARIKKAQDKKLEEAEQKLKEMEEHIDDFTQQEINQTIQIFHEINAEKTKAAMIQTKSVWLEHGEKPSKYYLNLEKHNYNKKSIRRLQTADGSSITGTQEILEFQRQYYKSLFTSHFDQEYIDTSYLEKIDLPKLKSIDFERIEQELEMSELMEAVKSLNHNKCPGLDGLSVEFYIVFWSKLAPFLYELFQEIIQDDCLNDSSTEGVISLLDKPDQNPLKLTNWRPLTLLTVDYKIFAKIIANRVSPTLTYMVHPQQTGFVKNRYIAENILDLMNVIEYCLVAEEPALVLNFDMAKAFDRLEWPALWAILNKMGFGPKILTMIRLLYKDSTRRIINKGHFSQTFNLERSTPQGCPWSPLAYVLSNEPLGAAIRQNVRIKGIKIGENEKKAAQYADDLWACIKAEQESLDELLTEVQRFCDFTGLRINFNKTNVLRIGCLRNTEFILPTQVPLQWTSDRIKILGVWITPHPTSTCILNYKEILSKIKARFTQWTDH